MSLSPESLVVLCLLLFADGATFSFATTPLLLQYGKFHEPWQVAVFGGIAQPYVTWLIKATGSPMAPAWYMMAAACVGIAAMSLMKETVPTKLDLPPAAIEIV